MRGLSANFSNRPPVLSTQHCRVIHRHCFVRLKVLIFFFTNDFYYRVPANVFRLFDLSWCLMGVGHMTHLESRSSHPPSLHFLLLWQSGDDNYCNHVDCNHNTVFAIDLCAMSSFADVKYKALR